MAVFVHRGSMHEAATSEVRSSLERPDHPHERARKLAMATKLFDSTIVASTDQALDFIGNILESSTEYSIIGKDLDGEILLWNEGARRLYGYEPEEVVGRANAMILHTEEDVAAGKPKEILDAALRDGKWEGTIQRRRKNGEIFTARVVITPRREGKG